MNNTRFPSLYKEKASESFRIRNNTCASAMSTSASGFSGFSPQVSAQSWAVCRRSDGALIVGRGSAIKREVASLTKILTCLVVIRYLEQSLTPVNRLVKISLKAASTEGTSCKVKRGEKARIIDLLYGLMLPSGNDAAVALSEHFGKLFLKKKRKINIKDPERAFLSEMNALAREIGMHDSFFANPHGMSLPKNKSSARDICLLASFALKYPLFYQISNTQRYSCTIYRKKKSRQAIWENTNRLLSLGFSGVKTGVTPKAGPCLCACKGDLIVVVLACSSREQRWVEVPELANWAASFIE